MSEAPSNPGISQNNRQNQAQIPSQAPAPDSVQDQLQAQDEHLDAHAAVLINQFLGKTRQLVTSELGDDFQCTICSEGFLRGENPEVPIKLDCGHVFGMNCILKWLSPLSRSGNNSCPNCRAKLFDDWDRTDFPAQESSASRRRRRATSRLIQINSLREGQSRRRFEEIDEAHNSGRSETNGPAPRRIAPIRRRGAPDPIEISTRQREQIMQGIEALRQQLDGRLGGGAVRETDETQNPGQGETDVPAPRRIAPIRRRGAPDPTETPVRQHEETQQIEGNVDVGGVRQVDYDAVREAARYTSTRGSRARLRARAPRRLGEVRVRQGSTDSRPTLSGLEGPIERLSIELGAARRPAEATTSTPPEVAPSVDSPLPSSSPEGVHQRERENTTATMGLVAPPRLNSYLAEINQRELMSYRDNQWEFDAAQVEEITRRVNANATLDAARREVVRRELAQRSAVADTPAPAEAAPVALEDDNGVASLFTAAENQHDLQRQQEATTKRKHHMWMQFCEGVVRRVEQSTDSAALANHDLALTIINMENLDEFIAERANESPTWRRILQTFPRLHTEMVTRFDDFRPLASVNISHRIELERLLSPTHFTMTSVHKARWLTRLSERLVRGAASSNHDAAVARLTERVAHLSSPFRESEGIAWPEGGSSAGEQPASEEGRQMQRMEDYLLGRTPVTVRREGAASVGAALRMGAEASFAMTVVTRL